MVPPTWIVLNLFSGESSAFENAKILKLPHINGELHVIDWFMGNLTVDSNEEWAYNEENPKTWKAHLWNEAEKFNVKDRITVFEGDSRKMIHNILDNAVKYAPADSNITVHVHANEQWAFCEIADEGEGIAVEEQQEVFKKFYRIGNEQVRKKKGTGLGLYLTKKIIDQHKGSVYLKEPKEKGCTFIIKLPLV